MHRYVILFLGISSYSQLVICEQDKPQTLMQLVPRTTKHLDIIKGFNYGEDVQILKRSFGLNDSLDILASENHTENIKKYAKLHDLDLTVKHEDYGKSFQVPDVERGRRFYNTFSVYRYNSYTAMEDHLDTILKRYPDLVTLETMGRTTQNRRLRLVKISSNPSANNSAIFIDAGIHAREWVAPAMAMFLIDRLVSDPEARKNELRGIDWYILPLVNPDGYEYSRSDRDKRLWRKTLSKSNYISCFGVDGNRNYGFKWGVSGVSNNPCDEETYAGPTPFSEPETRAVKDVMYKYSKRIKLYVSLHAYGQYLVYPWGYTGKSLPKTWQRLDSLARRVSDAVVRAGGSPFKVMSAGQWYPAAGGSDDFAFGAVGIPYSYTMELTKGHEFQFPEQGLNVVLPQLYEGFKEFAKQIRDEFGRRNHFTKATPLEDEDY